MKINFLKKTRLYTILAATVLVACGGNDNDIQGGTLENPPEPTTATWQLVWSDEFDGTTLNSDNWEVMLGDGTEYGIPGWGNNELQTYTDSNHSIVDGKLVIVARPPSENETAYTSTRLRTMGNYDFTYGRVEASIRVPDGQGLWPAFWMLASEGNPYGGWPMSGEIDVMEWLQASKDVTTSAIHFGAPGDIASNRVFIENDMIGSTPEDGFHQYAVEWDAEEIKFYFDGNHYATIKNRSYFSYYYKNSEEGYVQGGESAPFDTNFHLLLNLAVGGTGGGTPDASAFPGQMEVDYVRVYQCPLNNPQGLGCEGSIDDVNYYIQNDIEPVSPVITRYPLIDNQGLSTLYAGTPFERQLNFNVFDNSGAFSVQTVADDDKGTAINLVTTGGGNVSVVDANGRAFKFVNMGTSAASSSGADFKFSLKIDDDGSTDMTGRLQVKLDSTFPNVSYTELDLSNYPVGEWVEVSVKLSDMLAQNQGVYGGAPVDVNAVNSLVTFEPTSAANIYIADLSLVCGSAQFCGLEQRAVSALPLFDNQLSSLFDRGIVGYDTTINGDYNVSNPQNHVSWEIIDTDEEGYDSVIQTTFGNSATGGVSFIGSTSPINLSPWEDGELVFDVKVTSNPNGHAMMYKVDGEFRDGTLTSTTGDINLGILPVGEWQTVRAPLSSLATRGLVLSEMTAFVIFPTFAGQDVTFQWDNLRIEPTVTAPAQPVNFSESFTGVSPTSTTISGWQTFGQVPGAYTYGAPFTTPNGFQNGQGQIAGLVVDEDNIYIRLYSDYNNQDAHTSGQIVEISTFKEFTLSEIDSGNFSFTFDAKKPVDGGLIEPSQMIAFIKILDPVNGFATVLNQELDISNVSTDWTEFTVNATFDGEENSGRLLQVGFLNRSTNNASSSIDIDNMVFGTSTSDSSSSPELISLPYDFELDATRYPFMPFDGGNASIINNPDANGNSSTKVIELTKSAGQPWGGATLGLEQAVDFTTGQVFSMSVWTSREMDLTFKLEGLNREVVVSTSGNSAWETVYADFSQIDVSSAAVEAITLIIDNGTQGDFANNSEGWSLYLDDISLVAGLPTTIPVQPSSQLISFNNFEGGNASVIANPDTNGNDSISVIEFSKGAGATFAGSTILLDNSVNFTGGTIVAADIWTSRETAITLKLEGLNQEVVVNSTGDSSWETLYFDFSAFDTANAEITGVTIIMDNGVVGDSQNNPSQWTIYLDDIRLTNEIPVTTKFSYSDDFESYDSQLSTIDGWLTFVNIFDRSGNYIGGYGPGGSTGPSTAQNGRAFSVLTAADSGDAQGQQHVTVFSDYNNSNDQENNLLETNVFKEHTITSDDVGVFRFSSDVRKPSANAIAGESTMAIFIKVLDPGNGYSQVLINTLDVTDFGTDVWERVSVDANLTESMENMIVQFGFMSRTKNYEGSGMHFDNVTFESPTAVTSNINLVDDFESYDINATSIANGWKVFANVFNNGAYEYGYGPFDAANNQGGFAGIATGEAGSTQGTQYLNIFSDYNNADHGAGKVIEASVFKEFTIASGDQGGYVFSYDVKLPTSNAAESPSTVYAFIKVLDPDSGYQTTVFKTLDSLDAVNNEWETRSIYINIQEQQVGDIIQFGFASTATNYDATGVLYDNVNVSRK